MNELIHNLRALADALEQSGLDTKGVDARIHFHRIRDRELLASVARLMSEPRPDNNGGVHWLAGTIGGVEARAFYEAGLLGPTKRETVVVVEEAPDLAGLLGAPA